MKNIMNHGSRLKSAATSFLAAGALLLGGLTPNQAQAGGYEDLYLNNFYYYESLYADYGYDYTRYYLGLAVPSYYYYLGFNYSGYHSVYTDNYGEKGTGSYAMSVLKYYLDLGDHYLLSYY